MLRLFGAGLILCGGLLARRTLLEGSRRVQRTRRELAAALDAMGAEIRLLLTPVPALLRKTRDESVCVFFSAAAEKLERGMTLDEAWREAAKALSLPEPERETVAALGARLDGSEEAACAALSLCAASLRRAYEEAEAQRGTQERLTTTICICISLLFAILLA